MRRSACCWRGCSCRRRFLYRLEKPVAGEKAAPVNDWELASRLSYFLWSSLPDRELREAAAAGSLSRPEVLAAQARRMCKDPRIARLAREFACQWLHIYDFESLDEKSERHFPTFGKLKGAMHEEAILYFTDLFQNDGSVLSVFDGDHTFLNEALANHYGIPGVSGPGVAAGRRRQEVWPGRNTWPWRRRSPSNRAHRVPARSCAATGFRKCCWARSCPARPRTFRCCRKTRPRPRG